MKIKYCMECAARLIKKSDTHYVCRNGHDFYNNPRTSVTVILINVHGRVLFAKRAKEPKKGFYDLPGGYLNFQETAFAAAKRALYAEAGIALHDLKLVDASLNVHDDDVTSCSFVFVCTRWEGELTPAEDVEEFEWKSLEFMKDERFAWEYPGLYELLVPLTRNLKAKGFDIAHDPTTTPTSAHKPPRKLLQ